METDGIVEPPWQLVSFNVTFLLFTGIVSIAIDFSEGSDSRRNQAASDDHPRVGVLDVSSSKHGKPRSISTTGEPF